MVVMAMIMLAVNEETVTMILEVSDIREQVAQRAVVGHTGLASDSAAAVVELGKD